MGAIVERIRAAHEEAVVQRCAERRCECDLTGVGHVVILKGELVRRGTSICDCLVFRNGGQEVHVGVVELKSRTVDADEVVTKLQNGSQAALEVLRQNSGGQPRYKMCCVVLCLGWSTTEFRVVTSRRIHVDGRRVEIHAKRCGFALGSLFQ